VKKYKAGDLLRFQDSEAEDPKNRLAYCILLEINRFDFKVEWLDEIYDPEYITLFERDFLKYFTRLP